MSRVISKEKLRVETSAEPGLPVLKGAAFRYDLRTDSWDCSPEFVRLHGYQPGDVLLTSELLLAHQHPDDRADAVAAVEHVQHHPGTYVHSHRVIRADGETRSVVTWLTSEQDSSGRVIALRGQAADLEALPAAPRHRSAERAEIEVLRDKIVQLEIAIRSRDVIGQAKGMIMLATGRSEDEAFSTLVHLSQETNVKLRELAGRVVETLSSDPRLAAEITARLQPPPS